MLLSSERAVNPAADMNATWLRYLPPYFTLKLYDRQNLQALIDNSGWLLADKVIRGGAGLAMASWIARYLGPEHFGYLNFAVAFVALFSAIATVGIDGIVLRELVREPENKDEILGSAFLLKLMGGCIAFFVVSAAIWQVRPSDAQTHWLVMIIAAGMIFQAFDVADLWFQSQIQSRATVVVRDIAFLILASVKVGLILAGASVVAFAWAATAEIACGALGLVIAFRHTGQIWKNVRPNSHRTFSLIAQSWPQLFSGIAIVVYARIDQVMLAQMLGDHEVGLYSAAVRFTEVWNFVPAIIVSSAMPLLTEYRNRSKDLYYQRLQDVYTLMATAAYTVAIPMTFLAGPLVRAVYGEPYSAAGSVLAVHIWSGMFVFLGMATTIWTFNEGTMRIAFSQSVLGALCNILLNLYLIPLYGPLGCAIATTISYGFCAWVLNICNPKTRMVFRMQTRSLLTGLPLCAALPCFSRQHRMNIRT